MGRGDGSDFWMEVDLGRGNTVFNCHFGNQVEFYNLNIFNNLNIPFSISLFAPSVFVFIFSHPPLISYFAAISTIPQNSYYLYGIVYL